MHDGAKRDDDPAKDNWLANHRCSINFKGSPPAMELEGVKRICSHSEDYIRYILGRSPAMVMDTVR